MPKTDAQDREGGRLKPFKCLRATSINMGRGRKAALEQSHKKQKKVVGAAAFKR